jgi:hypothetical protein
MIEHCSNFDESYEGCRSCPGKLSLIQSDGTVETICRAGENYIKALIEHAELPVFPIPFPAPYEPPRRPA